MSKIIDTEWFDKGDTGLPNQTIGVVLIYNEHDGFKCYIGIGMGESQKIDSDWIYKHGTKLPFDIASAIWGKRMATEWLNDHLADDDLSQMKYDGKMYPRVDE